MSWALQALAVMLLLIAHSSPALSQDPYVYKERQNRREGRKEMGVAAPDLELLSFMGYREEVDPARDVSLTLRFYMPDEENLYITARELVVREFYQMNPTQTRWPKGWQEFRPWPTDQVLRPLRIPVVELGILGRLESPRIGSGRIVPILLYHSAPPARVTQYVVHARSREALRILDFSVYRGHDQQSVIAGGLRYLLGGVPFSASLDFSQREPGHYTLVLDAKYEHRIGGPQRRYTFFHAP